MNWPLDKDACAARRLGISLLETLVALAIIAVLLALVGNRMQRPSSQILAQRFGANLIDQAVSARSTALITGELRGFIPTAPPEYQATPCSESLERVGKLLFLPDGRAEGGPLCFSDGQRTIELSVDWLTGIPVVDIE